jgi:hypothetical protein
MAAIFCDEGLTWLAQYMHGDTTNGRPPGFVRLFTNNFTPSESSVLANFTQMAGLAYSRAALAGTSWRVNVDTTSHVATGCYTVGWNFIAGTAQTVYGWYITDEVAGVPTRVMIAERLANPITDIGTIRLTVALTLNITLKLCGG